MELFIQFSLIILVVLIISAIMRLLKQPMIIGYIFAGIITGPFFLNLIKGNETITAFSQIGIAFLLFIVGLSLSPKVIKEVGKISLITGIGQIVFTSIVGYFICIWLGLDGITSLYVSVTLTFSSTIIIMKLLSDKEALEKLYGKISIGFLLVQDFIAIFILILISSLAKDNSNSLIYTAVKGIILILILFPLSYLVFPKLDGFFAKSQEFLFLFAIALGLGLSSLFAYLGFSMEIGALIAGISLSISPYSYEISSRLKPLRDFFIISFFLILGSQIIITDISRFIAPIIILSLFILIGNPLIVMILMGMCGYSKKTGFLMGLNVAQVSEFSLIIIALGVKIGHLNSEILSLVTLIGLITITGSSYMIIYSESLFNFFSRYLNIFEKKNINEKETTNKKYSYFLFGENRIGFSIMKSFIKTNKNYAIVDFNPERVNKLRRNGINCIYGDVSDSEFLDSIGIKGAKLIVSTIPEKEINLLLLNKLKNQETIKIVTAARVSDVFQLYNKGADYVIMPHYLGGKFVSKLIEKSKEDKKLYLIEKKKDIKDLKERIRKEVRHV